MDTPSSNYANIQSALTCEVLFGNGNSPFDGNVMLENIRHITEHNRRAVEITAEELPTFQSVVVVKYPKKWDVFQWSS